MPTKKKSGCRRKGCVIPAASIALIVAVLAGREIYIASTATPGSAINYSAKITELVESFQPRSAPDQIASNDNGMDALFDALDAYEAAQSLGESDILWSNAIMTALDPSSHDAEFAEFSLEQFLETAEAVIAAMEEYGVNDHLDRLAKSTRYATPIPSQGKRVFDPHLGLNGTRSLARILALKTRNASENHDEATVVRSVTHSLALAKAISHQHRSMDRLVAMALFSLATEELRAALTTLPLTSQNLDKIAVALDRNQFPPLRFAIQGERLVILDAIQQIHTDDGKGSGRLIASQIDLGGVIGGPYASSTVGAKIVNLVSIGYPSRAETTEQANTLFDLVLEDIERSRQQRLAQISPHTTAANQLSKRQVTLRVLVQNFDEMIAAEDYFQALYAGTRVMVAIEQFNARNGEYPESLDQLVPELLPTLPTDPFATDGQIIYKIIDPTNDPYARPYTLYSVGYDQTNNDGIIDYEQNLAALRLKQSGFDFIFNLPMPVYDAPTPETDNPPEGP